VCSQHRRITGRSLVNIDAPWPELSQALPRVLAMQTKLHRWAAADPGRRFDDLANLVYDPNFLTVAWDRVRGNAGARTAGVDRIAPRSVGADAGELLADLRHDLKFGQFTPERVREKTIPRRRASCGGWGSRPPVTGSCRRR
jgi:RNA-directed DNA polymerase